MSSSRMAGSVQMGYFFVPAYHVDIRDPHPVYFFKI